MRRITKSFFICFGVFVVSMVLTVIIAGKDAWLFMGGFDSNQITVVTPEYRKMQWDAMMSHPWLLLPAILCLLAIINVFYSFWLHWNSFGSFNSNTKFGGRSRF